MSKSVSPPHVLLVEDSEDDAFFFRWTLEKCGLTCDLVHVADGGAAIEHLRAVKGGTAPRPDIVFLDLKLPTFSGFEILSWMQAQPSEPALRVFVLSGSEHVSDVTRAKSLGAAGYLVKPVSAAQLRLSLDGSRPADAAVGAPAVP